MRGTKLYAWRVPPVAQKAEFASPEGSMVGYMQKNLFQATQNVLAAIAADVAKGLRETVGLESEWFTGKAERASVIVFLPENINAEYVAEAVDLENLEAWTDDQKRLHIAISPWYSTKDVDQTVLCVIKVVSQFTGLLDVDMTAHKH